MSEIDAIFSMFQYGFFIRAFIGGIAAALLCSILGVFIVLRRSALIGEGVAHLSFGGIAIGLFFSIYPLYTALLLAVLGTLAISYLQRKKIVYSEAAIGILFSFGLALGAVLVSLSGGFNVDLFAYLFGSILTVTTGDLILISVLTIAVLLFVIFFYKELLHLTFDEQGARLSGVPVVAFEIIFNLVVALAVVVSIKIIGSLLVSSLLIIPASSAMQLAHSFKKTVWGSLMIGTISVICGLFVSFYYDVASGGAIVLISVGVFLVCVLFKKYMIIEVPDEVKASSK